MHTERGYQVHLTAHSRWLDTADKRLNDSDWRRVFEIKAVDDDTVRGIGYWEVRSREPADERTDVDAPWAQIAGGMIQPGRFSTTDFGVRFSPLDD